MLGTHRGLKPLSLLRGAGPSVFLRKAVEHTWGMRVFLGLRCDLESLPPIRRAKIEITMRPFDSRTFPGFVDGLKLAKGFDYIEAYLRKALCDAGVQTLHVATGPDGTPACAQWLVTPGNQALLHTHQAGRCPTLKPGEALLRGRLHVLPVPGRRRDGESRRLTATPRSCRCRASALLCRSKTC